MIDTSAIKQINTGDKTTRDVICNPRIVRIASANKEREKAKKKERKGERKKYRLVKKIFYSILFSAEEEGFWIQCRT